MSITAKTCVFASMSSIVLLMPFLVCAAGLDDALNYKPSPVVETSANVQAYTIQDIINKLPYVLDDNGVYKEDLKYRQLSEDPRIEAFNNENFGKCRFFYILNSGAESTSNEGLESVLAYSFPETEEEKTRASEKIKRYLKRLKGINWPECKNLDKYIVRIKEIFDTVIQAAPTILQEKQRLVAMAQAEIAKAQAEKMKKQEEQNRIARIKQQEEEKAKADKKARELAEAKGREERQEKLNACKNTNEYKLYAISTTINQNKMIEKEARMEMQHEEEGAKISGIVNKQVMYEMGNIIAGANRLNKENFEIYRKLGGSARNVESVNALPNPCDF